MEEMIDSMLKDYRWMCNEIERLERILYGGTAPMRSWGVAKYGIEATLPSGSNIRSQRELKNMDIREERLYKRLLSLRSRVYAIEMAIEKIESEEKKIIFECLLEKMSFREIGIHLQLSREKVRSLKKEIIKDICADDELIKLINAC